MEQVDSSAIKLADRESAFALADLLGREDRSPIRSSTVCVESPGMATGRKTLRRSQADDLRKRLQAVEAKPAMPGV